MKQKLVVELRVLVFARHKRQLVLKCATSWAELKRCLNGQETFRMEVYYIIYSILELVLGNDTVRDITGRDRLPSKCISN